MQKDSHVLSHNSTLLVSGALERISDKHARLCNQMTLGDLLGVYNGVGWVSLEAGLRE